MRITLLSVVGVAAEGAHHRLAPAAHAELAVDRLHVIADRMRLERQSLRRLPVALLCNALDPCPNVIAL